MTTKTNSLYNGGRQPLTASSSAEILTFPTTKPSFAVASKAWLSAPLADPSLTFASKTFCTAVYLHFNVKIYQETGQLVAWPSWDTLSTKFGLSRETINESIKQVERAGYLDIQRGRHDGHRRAGNRYFARTQGQNSGPWQGQNFRGEQGQKYRLDSVITESIGESIRGERTQGQNFSDSDSDSAKLDSAKSRTPERALRPEEAEEAKPAKKYNATPELVAAVARWRAVATNGGGR